MIGTTVKTSRSLLIEEYIQKLESGAALLRDSPQNLIEVVGVLKSYGVVLDAYSTNLCYIANTQFLKQFPFFKYFNGEVNPGKIARFFWQDRINYEYAEYCMKTMFWHGGGGLDAYLDTPEFLEVTQQVIKAKFKYNPLILGLNALFKDFLPEQMRQMAYYSGLGQFWRVMSDIFLNLSVSCLQIASHRFSIQNSKFKIQNRFLQVSNPKFKIQNPKLLSVAFKLPSAFNPKFKIQNPKLFPTVSNPKSLLTGLHSKIQNRFLQVFNPKLKIQNPKLLSVAFKLPLTGFQFKIQNSKSKIASYRFPIQNSKSKIQNCPSVALKLPLLDFKKISIQNSKSKIQNCL